MREHSYEHFSQEWLELSQQIGCQSLETPTDSDPTTSITLTCHCNFHQNNEPDLLNSLSIARLLADCVHGDRVYRHEQREQNREYLSTLDVDRKFAYRDQLSPFILESVDGYVFWLGIRRLFAVFFDSEQILDQRGHDEENTDDHPNIHWRCENVWDRRVSVNVNNHHNRYGDDREPCGDRRDW